MRCSTDHHNVLVQPAPVPYLHHTFWEVEDVDEIGRGAHHMLEGHPPSGACGGWADTTSVHQTANLYTSLGLPPGGTPERGSGGMQSRVRVLMCRCSQVVVG